jgi:soluble lytic murein transglycosylase-like protein
MHESSWNPNADNPTSTAYGIPQFLDSTWAGTGYAKTSDPYTQIDAGLVYIAKSYGTPCGAWSFWQAHNWY